MKPIKSITIFIVFISLFGTSCKNVPPAVAEEGEVVLQQKVLPQLEKAANYIKDRYIKTNNSSLNFETFGTHTVPFPSPKGVMYQKMDKPQILVNNQLFNHEQVTNGDYQQAFNKKYELPVVKSVVTYATTHPYIDNTYQPKLNNFVLKNVASTPEVDAGSVWDSRTNRILTTVNYSYKSVKHDQVLSDLKRVGGVGSVGTGSYYLTKTILSKGN